MFLPGPRRITPACARRWRRFSTRRCTTSSPTCRTGTLFHDRDRAGPPRGAHEPARTCVMLHRPRPVQGDQRHARAPRGRRAARRSAAGCATRSAPATPSRGSAATSSASSRRRVDPSAAMAVAERIRAASSSRFGSTGSTLDVECEHRHRALPRPRRRRRRHCSSAPTSRCTRRSSAARRSRSTTAEDEPVTPSGSALRRRVRRALDERRARRALPAAVDLADRAVVRRRGARAAGSTRATACRCPASSCRVAEQTGLIRPLTRVVLDQALRAGRGWLDAGPRPHRGQPVAAQPPRSALPGDDRRAARPLTTLAARPRSTSRSPRAR